MRSGASSHRKEESCDPLDPLDRLQGDDQDHAAVDPESRAGPARCRPSGTVAVSREDHDRTQGRTDLPITGDGHAPV